MVLCVFFFIFFLSSHLEVEDTELQQPRAAEEDDESRDGKSDGCQERFAAETNNKARRQALTRDIVKGQENAHKKQWEFGKKKTKNKKTSKQTRKKKRERERQK